MQQAYVAKQQIILHDAVTTPLLLQPINLHLQPVVSCKLKAKLAGAMASVLDQRHDSVDRSKAQWMCTLAAVTVAVCAGYLLGKAAAADGVYALGAANIHAAIGSPAALPDRAEAAAASNSSSLQHAHERTLLQIGVAVAVSYQPQHVSGQRQSRAALHLTLIPDNCRT